MDRWDRWPTPLDTRLVVHSNIQNEYFLEIVRSFRSKRVNRFFDWKNKIDEMKNLLERNYSLTISMFDDRNKRSKVFLRLTKEIFQSDRLNSNSIDHREFESNFEHNLTTNKNEMKWRNRIWKMSLTKDELVSISIFNSRRFWAHED